MLKDTKSLGNNKAPACESRGFVLKKKVCFLTHLLFLFEDCLGQKARCEKYVWTFHPFFLHETGGFSGENFCSTSTI